jgi:enoyl-CoA hydratase/carnithine racemase
MQWGSALSMDVTPFDTLRKSAKPVVSAVNGLCQGGGLQIAMCSDVAVVSERATFRAPSCTGVSPTPITARCWRASWARSAPAI